MEILSSLYLVRTQDTIFDSTELQRKYRKYPFVLGDAYLTPFCQRVHWISVKHMDKIHTHKCYTKSFVPVTSLNGVVRLLSLFIRSFIGITGKM